MKLKKLFLENIRSYKKQEINFDLGSTLLAGNIGSGKSSILFAVDFALFGLRRGFGASLLRSGEKKGLVELEFDIDGKEVIVKRTLKKGKTIGQDVGSIIIDGVEEKGTAVELKSKILGLLNYPKEMLTKDSLIYKYTVYTPQEEMKSILLGEREKRLDTLRKVFGIDRYKRIQENSIIFSHHLRAEIKELEGRILDFDDKNEVLKLKNKNLRIKKKDLTEILPDFDQVSKELKDINKKIKDFEGKILALNKLREKISNLKVKLNMKKKELSEKNEKIVNLEIKEIEEIKKPDINKIGLLKDETGNLKNLLAKLQNKIENSEELKEKIMKLNVCPTCEQKVMEQHKTIIGVREDKNVLGFKDKIELYNEELIKKEEELKNLEFCNDKYKEFVMKKEIYENKLKLKQELLEEIKNLDKEILNLDENIKKEEDSLDLSLEKEFVDIKLEKDEIFNKLRGVEVKKVGVEKEIEVLKENIKELKKELKEKLDLKKKLDKFMEFRFWLNEHFVKLMETMEKKVMARVHADFNSLFQKWFDILVADELLKIELDEEFSLKIDQAGHEIDYEFLSGGEKTAAALAYRLALNQVISGIVSEIKTKNLLILDEPTDGFSAEQIDRMKDVLGELSANQVIIVSHDPKIESFVDRVIKIEKKEHVSGVLQ